MEYLFSYGTLRERKIQLAIFKRPLSMKEDEALGYELSTQKAYGKYLLVQKSDNPKAVLPGSVLEVTPQDLIQADRYEGPEYQRILVPLKSGKQAWLYIAK